MTGEPTNTSSEQIGRPTLDISIGATVRHDGTTYRVEAFLDEDRVLAVDMASGRSARLRLCELQEPEGGERISRHDCLQLTDESWAEVQRRYQAIEPLVRPGGGGRKNVVSRATELGCGPATLYRWIRQYREGGRTASALLERKRGWREGASRLCMHTERVVGQTIDDFYLAPDHPTAQATIEEIEHRCHERGLKPPSPYTVRRRLHRLDQRHALRRRGFKDEAEGRYGAYPGRLPDDGYPLETVQIDHTPLDIMVVDEVHRKSIGHPWLTLGMDICTRMITGFYLSFDAPSETSVGMCIAQGALPKESYLAQHGIEGSWPVCGYPQTLHVDNGPDFRSRGLERSCIEHGINITFRPVKKAHYGGHIERVLGTVSRAIHKIPGSTFSSPKDRGNYDSEKNACMTIAELEAWLLSWIVNTYHASKHKTLEMSPLQKWDIGINGRDGIPGIGQPTLPGDAQTAYISFLPHFSRTIQRQGVSIDGLTYFDDVLRPWVGRDDKTTKQRQKFIFRRDPRDVRVVWFHDPSAKEYFKLRLRDTGLPSFSAWELERIKEQLKNDGLNSQNSSQLKRALLHRRARVDEAKEKTKVARREESKRREHEKKAIKAAKDPTSARPAASEPEPPLAGLVSGDLGVLGDVE